MSRSAFNRKAEAQQHIAEVTTALCGLPAD